MSLNESIVEDAALEWFGELSYAFGHGPHLAPGEPASRDGGRDSFGEVVQSRVARTLIPAFSQREKEEDREAIRRLNTAISEEARAAIKRYLKTRFERRVNP